MLAKWSRAGVGENPNLSLSSFPHQLYNLHHTLFQFCYSTLIQFYIRNAIFSKELFQVASAEKKRAHYEKS